MIMKRRNIEAVKIPRRSGKRNNKFTENVCGNTFVVTKFLLIWLLIMLVDFILEFRFEYIWPAWLLMQSVYETFKYQGFVYSMFFICIAITSDTICLLFIPIQGLFFLASAYVWIHYVWHTDKGICLPTALMWLVIMCVEVTIRINDIKSGQLHIRLCQPFAAHCIGHPIVTLGIGFKSYVFYRLKLHTQWQVRKENSFYYELLKQALPGELQHNHTLALTDKNDGAHHCNGFVSTTSTSSKKSQEKNKDLSMQIAEPQNQHQVSTSLSNSQQKFGSKDDSSTTKAENDVATTNLIIDREVRKRAVSSSKKSSADTSSTSQGGRNSSKSSSNEVKLNKLLQSSQIIESHQNSLPNHIEAVLPSNNLNNDAKVELVSASSAIEQLEATISKLKAELSSALKSKDVSLNQIDLLTNAEQTARAELSGLRKDHELLQTRYNSLVSNKESYKVNMLSLEKRLRAEADCKETTEKLLQQEKQRRIKFEETAAAALLNRNKESAEILSNTKKEFEEKIDELRKKYEGKNEDCRKLENKVKELQAHEKSTDTLMSAIDVMKEKNVLLEKSLSAETRLKLDLFSALGECKRQLEIAHAAILRRDAELTDLKVRMSDILSVMPEQRHLCSSAPHYSANFLEQPGAVPLASHNTDLFCTVTHNHPPPATAIIQAHPNVEAAMQSVHLDPNAAVYTPNTSEV